MGRWRMLVWSAAMAALLLPAVAMQFSAEVAWGPMDFVFAGVLIFGALGLFETAARMTGNAAYRAGVAVALLTAFALIWINIAVGLIGEEGNAANLMYGTVLLVGIAGVFVSRLVPEGMARAMTATAMVQALVAAIALLAGLGSEGPLSVVFAAPWLLSAWLFRKAASQGKFAKGTA